MNVNIEAIHFDVKPQLDEFIKTRINKLEQYSDAITSADVQLKVIKPETANNKEVMIKILIPGNTIVVDKTADSFEEAFDNAVDVAIKLVVKTKEKNKK